MQVGQSGMDALTRTYNRHVGAVQPDGTTLPARSTGRRPRTDSVAFSSTVQELLRVRDAAAVQPDVRAERVAALRAAVAGGAYQVDTHALAWKLVG